MRKLVFLLTLILVLGLVACGGESAPAGGSETGGGDAAAGEKVFDEVAAPACNTCHSLESDVVLVGPSLAGIGTTAGSRESGKSAEDYLHESIVDPNAFVVEGFAANIMTSNYGSQLSEQQINDLVAYMLTLK